MNSLWFLLKRGEFWDPKNQRFPRNRGLFKVKVSEKGGIFLMWRTLMGHANVCEREGQRKVGRRAGWVVIL